MERKIAGVLTWIKAVAPNIPLVIIVFVCSQKIIILLKDVFHKAIKLYLLFSTSLAVVCDELGSISVVLKYGVCLKEKPLCACSGLFAELATFSRETIFTWKNNWQIHGLFRLEYLANIFSKMKWVCQFQETTDILASDKLWACKWKYEFWKTCPNTISLTVFQYLQGFLMRLVLILMNVTF